MTIEIHKSLDIPQVELKQPVVAISPTGNQHVVEADKWEQFKEVLKVDDSWSVIDRNKVEDES